MTFKCRTGCSGQREVGKVACPHCLRHVPRYLLSNIANSKGRDEQAIATRRIYEYLTENPPPPVPQTAEKETGQ